MIATLLLPKLDEFVLKNISGLRIASYFPPEAPGIDTNFAVQVLVVRTATPPNELPPVEEGRRDLAQHLGNTGRLTVKIPNELDYKFRPVTLKQVECAAVVAGGAAYHLCLLGFDFTNAPLASANKVGEDQAVRLKYTSAQHIPPPVQVGSFGLAIPPNVAMAARQADNGAPERLPLDDVPAAAQAQGGAPEPIWSQADKPLQVGEQAFESTGQLGAIWLVMRRDAWNPWIDAMLVQNCAQAAAPAGVAMRDTRVQSVAPVPGGGLVLTINGRTWTGKPLDRSTVGGYFVEEVWGACSSYPPLGAEMACQLVRFGDNKSWEADVLKLQAWLLPLLSGFGSGWLSPAIALEGAAHSGVERVAIRFIGGLRPQDRLFS